RDLAFGVDAPVVLAGFGFLLLIVDLLQFEIVAGFPQHNVWRQRAGTGSEIEFHQNASLNFSENFSDRFFSKLVDCQLETFRPRSSSAKKDPKTACAAWGPSGLRTGRRGVSGGWG